MSNQPGRDPRRHRRRRSGSHANTPNEAEPQASDNAAATPVHLSGLDVLERLRDRVEVAARELRRLRDENAHLVERIRELEAHPATSPSALPLSLDKDPELLRRRITGFIEAIDRYLEKETSQE